MNSPVAEVPGTDRPAAAPAGAGTGRTLLTLVRREFWEHRALWMAPLALAVLLALCAIPPHVRVDLGDPEGGLGRYFDQQKVALFTLVRIACTRSARTAAFSSGSPCRCPTA